MKYKNTKTGAVIETTSELGGNWMPVVDKPKKEEKPAPKKKGPAKK